MQLVSGVVEDTPGSASALRGHQFVDHQAMAGDVMIPTKYGQYKAGEYPRVLATWEAQERDRLANFAAKAVAAGLAERQVRLAEKQGQVMAEMVQSAVKEAGLNSEQAAALMASLSRQVRALTS